MFVSFLVVAVVWLMWLVLGGTDVGGAVVVVCFVFGVVVDFLAALVAATVVFDLLFVILSLRGGRLSS